MAFKVEGNDVTVKSIDNVRLHGCCRTEAFRNSKYRMRKGEVYEDAAKRHIQFTAAFIDHEDASSLQTEISVVTGKRWTSH